MVELADASVGNCDSISAADLGAASINEHFIASSSSTVADNLFGFLNSQAIFVFCTNYGSQGFVARSPVLLKALFVFGRWIWGLWQQSELNGNKCLEVGSFGFRYQ